MVRCRDCQRRTGQRCRSHEWCAVGNRQRRAGQRCRSREWCAVDNFERRARDGAGAANGTASHSAGSTGLTGALDGSATGAGEMQRAVAAKPVASSTKPAKSSTTAPRASKSAPRSTKTASMSKTKPSRSDMGDSHAKSHYNSNAKSNANSIKCLRQYQQEWGAWRRCLRLYCGLWLHCGFRVQHEIVARICCERLCGRKRVAVCERVPLKSANVLQREGRRGVWPRRPFAHHYSRSTGGWSPENFNTSAP